MISEKVMGEKVSLWLIILMLKARHLHFKGSEFIKRKLKTLIEKDSGLNLVLVCLI